MCLRLLLCATLFVCGAGLNACSDPAPQCAFDGDCIQLKEYCDSSVGQCVRLDVPECAKKADCKPLEMCRLPAGVCVLPGAPDETPDMPTSNDSSVDMPADDGPSIPDVPVDLPPNPDEAPIIIATQPAPQGPFISLNQRFKVAFSEPMDPLSISTFTITLEDSQYKGVDAMVTLSADGVTASLTPVSPLKKGSFYTVVVSSSVRDLNETNLQNSARFVYFTAAADDPYQAQLAQKWAPHIYQALASTSNTSWRADVPTILDFDNDYNATNNLTSSSRGAIDYKAQVYYHVSSTTTHHFLHYVMYYPSRVTSNSSTGMDEVTPHDLTGAVFVVEKATDKLVFVEGVSNQPNGSDQLISYRLRDAGYDAPGQLIRRTFEASQMEDTTHYPMFITSRIHEACNWKDGEPLQARSTCKHPDSAFQGAGVKMIPGVAQGYPEAQPNAQSIPEMTYALVPFNSLFWARRSDVGPNALFSSTQVYNPSGNRQSGYNANEPGSHVFPTVVASNDPNSVAPTPFTWLINPIRSNAGQWFIDPAYELRQRYSVPNGESSWSQVYCYNDFFNIMQSDCGATP